LQLGGQSYSQIIFFGTKKAFDEFKRGETQLSANASAVILKKGKSHGATYKNGTAIVILKEKGLMGELSVGGQKLSYKPLVSR
jgi:lipid-binding SYLF domain-containing protein